MHIWTRGPYLVCDDGSVSPKYCVDLKIAKRDNFNLPLSEYEELTSLLLQVFLERPSEVPYISKYIKLSKTFKRSYSRLCRRLPNNFYSFRIIRLIHMGLGVALPNIKYNETVDPCYYTGIFLNMQEYNDYISNPREMGKDNKPEGKYEKAVDMITDSIQKPRIDSLEKAADNVVACVKEYIEENKKKVSNKPEDHDDWMTCLISLLNRVSKDVSIREDSLSPTNHWINYNFSYKSINIRADALFSPYPRYEIIVAQDKNKLYSVLQSHCIHRYIPVGKGSSDLTEALRNLIHNSDRDQKLLELICEIGE